MKKRVKISNSSIKNIIRRNLSEEVTISDSNIDSIIKEYLFERSEYVVDEEPIGDKATFSPKSTEALDDMVFGLNEMIDDLDIIKEKEGDVLVEADFYTDEYISTLMESLRDFISNLEHLNELTKGDDDVDNVEMNLDV